MLNGPGFSITLCNLAAAAEQCGSPVSELLDLLAADTAAPAWPNVRSNTSTKAKRKPAPIINLEKKIQVSDDENIHSVFSFLGTFNTAAAEQCH